jgi:signal transduction histidine kinase
MPTKLDKQFDNIMTNLIGKEKLWAHQAQTLGGQGTTLGGINISPTIHVPKPNSGYINNKNFPYLEIAITKNNKLIKKTKNFKFEDFKKYLSKQDNFFLIKNSENKNALYILSFDDPFKGKIIIFQKEIDENMENVLTIMFILNPILLVLLLLVGNKVIDKILDPVKKLTKTAKEITVENFSHTIEKPKETNEISELVNSFNEMIIRLKEGVDNLDRFNSDVSHELKTPITAIKGEIEITLKKYRDPKYYEKSLRTIFYEIDQLQKIVEDLLLLTKYTKSNIKQTFKECNLDTVIINAVESFTKKAAQKDINIDIKCIEPISISANESLIYSIVSNLLDNAIKYSPQGKSIYISLYKYKKIFLIIEDEGIGVDQDKLSKITDRFYRVDESRNKKIKGFGLGLSIVKNAVELHNANLHIVSTKDKGTTVTVIF